MMLVCRLALLGVFLLMYFFPWEKLFVPWVFANDMHIQQEAAIHTFDILEDKITSYIAKKEDTPLYTEIKEQLEDTQEEIADFIDQQQEDIQDAASTQQINDIVEETKRRIVLKTVDGLTDHDALEETIQVEGDEDQKEQAIETAIESMQHKHQTIILIRTKSSFAEVEKIFHLFDASVGLTSLFQDEKGHTIEVRIGEDSIIQQDILEEIDQWVLPDTLLGFPVVKPEIYEIGTIDIIWEQIPKTRWVEFFKAHKLQSQFRQLPKVTVWVVDTWIDPTHPDLKAQLSRTIPWYDFVNKDADPRDDHIHGTHVAWTIAAAANGRWIMWVNTNIELVPLKICTARGYCPSYAIYNAVKYAADKGVDVLNMSLWWRGTIVHNTTCQAIDYATKKGTIIVAAAGNANMNVIHSIPWACPNTITVWAIDANKKRASFSNYGTRVDVSAPGVGIYSTVPHGWYKSLNGTSMAAPHIAAIVAAITAKHPTYTTAHIKTTLKNNSMPVTHESHKPIGPTIDLMKLMENIGIDVRDIKIEQEEQGTVQSEEDNEATIQSIDSFTVNHRTIQADVGEFVTVTVNGWVPSYTITRTNKHVVWFAHVNVAQKKGISLASAWDEHIATFDTDEEELFDEETVFEEIDFGSWELTEEEIAIITQDQAEYAKIASGDTEIDAVDSIQLSDEQEIWTWVTGTGVEVASAGSYSFKVFWLQAWSTELIIKDKAGKTMRIPIIIKSKVIHLWANTRTYIRPARGFYKFAWLYRTYKRNLIYYYRWRSNYIRTYTRRGPWLTPLDIRIYNYTERRYQTMKYTAYVGSTSQYKNYMASSWQEDYTQKNEENITQPAIKTNLSHITTSIDMPVKLDITYGTPPFTIRKEHKQDPYIWFGTDRYVRNTIGIASAWSWVTNDEFDFESIQQEGEDTLPPQDLETYLAEVFTGSGTWENIQVANALWTRDVRSIYVFWLKPGKTSITIQDAKGKKIKVPVTITEKIVTLDRNKSYRYNYFQPLKAGTFGMLKSTGIADKTIVDIVQRHRYKQYEYHPKQPWMTQINMRFYNILERQYQYLQYKVKVKNPQETLLVDNTDITLIAWQKKRIRISWWYPQYKAEQSSAWIWVKGIKTSIAWVGIASAQEDIDIDTVFAEQEKTQEMLMETNVFSGDSEDTIPWLFPDVESEIQELASQDESLSWSWQQATWDMVTIASVSSNGTWY